MGPTRNRLGMASRTRHLPAAEISMLLGTTADADGKKEILTRFLNCLWMASNASLMVTPFMFRATTSRPSGKCRVIFLTLGRHNGSFRTAGSSTLVGDSFSFLWKPVSLVRLTCFQCGP
jgi:hypothetical protein